jgi:hypothetical protein
VAADGVITNRSDLRHRIECRYDRFRSFADAPPDDKPARAQAVVFHRLIPATPARTLGNSLASRTIACAPRYGTWKTIPPGATLVFLGMKAPWFQPTNLVNIGSDPVSLDHSSTFLCVICGQSASRTRSCSAPSFSLPAQASYPSWPVAPSLRIFPPVLRSKRPGTHRRQRQAVYQTGPLRSPSRSQPSQQGLRRSFPRNRLRYANCPNRYLRSGGDRIIIPRQTREQPAQNRFVVLPARH